MKPSDAPEVAYSQEAPILASSDSGGLQTTVPTFEKRDTPYQDQNYPAARETGQPGNAHDAYTQPLQQAARSRHKSLFLCLLFSLLAALVGLGVGVGIGYPVGFKNGKEKAASNYLPTASTTYPTSTASATSSAVTSGTTGIAAFSCNTTAPDNVYTSNAITSKPVSFTEECYADYPGGDNAWNSSTVQVTDLAAVTVYSFEACMDQCVVHNSGANGGTLCQAVTYGANLTMDIQDFSGNCWLKNVRGVRDNVNSAENYSLVASAYITADQ